jgi:hypothetical protein
MFTLIKLLGTRQLVTEQLPALVCAFVIAEFFYKFHSFALECLAFLATWFVIDLVISLGTRMLRGVPLDEPGQQR